MTGRQVGVVGLALGAVGALAVLLWPRPGPSGPCAAAADPDAVGRWRQVAVQAVAEPTTAPSSRCRTAWRDARNARRTLLEVSVHRAKGGPGELGAREPGPAAGGGEVDHLGRAGVEVTVRRTPQRRAIVVVPLGVDGTDEVWAELVIHDEQQGDVAHWVDEVLAQRDDVLAALAPD